MNFCSTLTCIPFPTEELHDRTAPSLKCDVSLVTDIRGCRFHVHSNIYLLHVFTLSHRFLAYEIERIGYSSILQDDHKFITFEKGTSCPKCWQEKSKMSLGFWRTVVEDVQSFKHQTWYIDAATRGNSSRLTKCCVFSFGIVLYLILLYVYTRNNSHPIKAKDVFFLENMIICFEFHVGPFLNRADRGSNIPFVVDAGIGMPILMLMFNT